MGKFRLILVTFLLFLTGCSIKNNQYDFPRKHILYNDILNPYFIVIGYPHSMIDFKGERQEINTYDIYMNYSNPDYSDIKDIVCAIYTVDYADGKNLIFDNKDYPFAYPSNEKILDSALVAGNGFKEVYGRFNFNYKGASEEFIFSEPILQYTDKNISYKNYSNTWNNTNFILEILHIKENDNNLFDFKISFNSGHPMHLDIQTWLIVSYGEVFPFMGIYNYCGIEQMLEFNSLPVETRYSINSICVRANYWLQGRKETVLFRYDFDSQQ